MEKIEVFIVIRSGIYRHDVLGVFDDLDEAKALAHESVQSEHDHYHSAEILRCVVGQQGEIPLGAVEADWERHPNRSKKYIGTKYTKAT